MLSRLPVAVAGREHLVVGDADGLRRVGSAPGFHQEGDGIQNLLPRRVHVQLEAHLHHLTAKHSKIVWFVHILCAVFSALHVLH